MLLLKGCRYVRRPFFDFGKISYRETKCVNVFREFHQYWFHLNLLNKNINNIVQHSPTVYDIKGKFEPNQQYSKMALNKLSIDKVDLTDKRVLIR